MTLYSSISSQAIISLSRKNGCLIRTDTSIQQVYLDIKLHKYTKKLTPSVVQSVYLGLLVLNGPNIVYSKLVSIDKLESITEVVTDSSSFSRGLQCFQIKLTQKFTFIDAIYTTNSTLIFKYGPKLLKPRTYIKIAITISKYRINASYINSFNYIVR